MSLSKAPLDDPDALRAWRDSSLYRLVFRASRAETTETLTRLHRRGHPDTITLAATSLLANLDTEGTTISALARRAGMTRQGASQQLADLERDGYVVRRPDPDDARAVLVRQSAKGRALFEDAVEVVSELEDEYAAFIGAERLAVLKELLAELVDHVDPAGRLGRD